MSKIAKIRAAVSSGVSVAQSNIFRTQIDAQSAAAGPPLGPILGQYGLNIAAFCKDFNERTKDIKQGVPLPVTVRVKPDRSYDLGIHTPPIEYYLFQAAGIERGKVEGDKTPSGKVTIRHVYEIAKIKHEDIYEKFQLFELHQVVKRIMLVAQENGIEVTKNLDPDEYQEFLTQRFAYLDEIDKRLEEERMAKLMRA